MEAKLLELITRLETELAPYALQAAIGVIRVGAIWDILVGVALAAAFIVITRWLMSLWWTWKTGYDDEDETRYRKRVAKEVEGFMGESDRQLLTGLGITACAVIFVAEFWLLLSPWTYVALFNPKLELAHRIMSALLK